IARLKQEINALAHAGMAGPPAEELAAKQAHGRRSRAIGRRIVAVAQAAGVGYGIEETGQEIERRLRHLESGERGSFEGGELPAADRRVALGILGIAPATALILRANDIVDGGLSPRFQTSIAAQAIGLTEGNRGQGVFICVVVKIAFWLLLAGQVFEAQHYPRSMPAALVSFPRAQKRQNPEGCAGHIALGVGVVFASAIRN